MCLSTVYSVEEAGLNSTAFAPDSEQNGEGRKRSPRIPRPSTFFLELVDSKKPLKENLAAPYLLQARDFLSTSVKALPSMCLYHLPTPLHPPTLANQFFSSHIPPE